MKGIGEEHEKKIHMDNDGLCVRFNMHGLLWKGGCTRQQYGDQGHGFEWI